MTATRDAPGVLDAVSWVTVTVPLPGPLQAGTLVIESRQYCCVRVTLAGGATGEAFTLTRGLDVGAALGDLIVPRLLGKPVVPDLTAGADGGDLGPAARLRVALRNAGWDGPISRAASLVFLAALDAHARSRGEPVWRLLTAAAGPPAAATRGRTPAPWQPQNAVPGGPPGEGPLPAASHLSRTACSRHPQGAYLQSAHAQAVHPQDDRPQGDRPQGDPMQGVGGQAAAVPRTIAAIGYTPVGEEAGAAEVAEAHQAAAAGADCVKLMGGFAPPEVDLERLGRVRAAVGETCAVALDVNGAWPVAAAVAVLPRLADLGVAFVEEPWAYELGLGALTRLGGEPRPALAFGEVSASVVELEALAATGAVRHVRADATLIGGAEPLLRLLPAVAANGCELMPHFWPEVHRHLTAAYPGPAWVEGTLPDTGVFGLDRFVDGVASVGAGLAHPPSTPGFGYTLDWAELTRLAGPPTTRTTKEDP